MKNSNSSCPDTDIKSNKQLLINQAVPKWTARPIFCNDKAGNENQVKRAKHNWDYPYDEEKWRACCVYPPGNEQSPIDLPASLEKLSMSLKFKPCYGATPIKFGKNGLPTNLVNNGHTIQMNVEREQEQTLSYNGKVFDLLQFHFHTSSEHTVNKKSFPLEMHMVHKLRDGDDLLVLGIFFQTYEAKGDKKPNDFLASFWDYLPGSGSKTSTRDVHVHLDELAAAISRSSFYKYNGSLTTPPLSEGVTWLVAKEPLCCTMAQVLCFRERSGQQGNFRPPQPLNNRMILRAEMAISKL